MQHCTKNKFFSVKNTTKLCAEGAIGNLMNLFHCNEIEVNQFWSIVQSPINLIQKNLGESAVPKAVQKKLGSKCDSIQKSLWILRKKFKFTTTSLLRIEHFKYLKNTIKILIDIKFPLIISVMGTHACYHHVVVVWRGMVIDYESEYTFSLTNDSLRQICGVNTTFVGIVVVMEYFHPIIFVIPWTIFLLKIRQSMNTTSKAVPLENILSDK